MSKSFVPITLGAPEHTELDVDGFHVIEARFPPGLALAPHEHERASIAVMLDGSFDLEIRGREYSCPPHTVTTEPSGERHANQIQRGGAHVLVMQPDPARRELLRPYTDLLDGVHHFPRSPVFLQAHRITRELALQDGVTPMAVEGLVFEILGLLARSLDGRRQRAIPRWIVRVEEMLHTRFLEPLRVTEIAVEAGVHPAHLMRVFRARHGVSMGTYLRRLRLDWAARRLSDTEDSLAQVAHEAGFADQSHFTRLFRHHTGLTPARYRRARTP